MIDLKRYLKFAIWGEKTAAPRRRRRVWVHRSPDYLAWLRKQSCCCGCGRGPSEAAHTGNDGGMSLKASDWTCVPLFPECHRLYHQAGRVEFERRRGIDFDVVSESYFTEWSARQ